MGSMNDDGDGDGLAYDSESSSVIKLNNGMVLYLREVNKCVLMSTVVADASE